MSTPKHYNTSDNFQTFLELITKKQSCDIIDIANYRNWNFCVGNVVKYLDRAGKKDGEAVLKDLAKAIDYINRQAFTENATMEEKIAYIQKLEGFVLQAKIVLHEDY